MNRTTRRRSYSRREHDHAEITRRLADPRCADCTHRDSEHRESPYPDHHRWCVADRGDGEPCECEAFRMPEDDVAAWVAGEAGTMGEPMIGYSGADWSRRRITAVMGDAADRCAALAHIVGTGRLGDDIGDLRRQAQSVQVLHWAEGIFRSWAEDTTVERGIGLDDLEQARRILDTAERAMA